MEYIDIKNGYTKEDIKKVIDIIKIGGIVILPTDTVYGIATSAINEKAVEKIYKLKKRPLSNPINILVSNIEMIKKAVKDVSPKEEKIIKKFLPGALTIILEKKELIPDIVTAGRKTIGVRMPDNKFLLELIEELNVPIIATSCNFAGEEALTKPEDILKKFDEKVEIIITEGESNLGKPSTIVKIEDDEIKILREGPIKKEEIEREIKTC